MWRVMVVAAFMAGLAGTQALPDTESHVLPEILLEHTVGMVRIEGVVSGTGPADVTATLSIAHRGSGGSMSTQQSRNLSLMADDKQVSIASTAMNFGPESHLVVELSVTRGDVVIAFSKVEIGVAP